MAGPTLGSEGDSIECWENYTAGEVMVQGLAGQIHQEDVEAIVRAQKQMLQRFEKTNEMLSNCNALSASRYASANQEFAKHSAMLLQSKKDLDYIFKKIRNIRSKLEIQYPQAVAATLEKFREEDEEEGQDALTEDSKLCSDAGPQSTADQHHLSSSPSAARWSGGPASTGSGDTCKQSSGGTSDGSAPAAAAARDAKPGGGSGGENCCAAVEDVDEEDQEDLLSGRLKRVSGRLHHVSSSDSSTSSAKSSYSSTDS